jgi:uncharacterized membrane protein YkgB
MNNCYRCTPNPEYLANRAPTVYKKTSASEVIGILVILVGIVLLIGNLTGLFPTFPYAGFIVMFVGGLIAKSG